MHLHGIHFPSPPPGLFSESLPRIHPPEASHFTAPFPRRAHPAACFLALNKRRFPACLPTAPKAARRARFPPCSGEHAAGLIHPTRVSGSCVLLPTKGRSQVVTPKGSVLGASLGIWPQADPTPPLRIPLLLSHGQTPVLRIAEGLWLPGEESQLLSGSLMQRGLAVPKHPWLLWIMTQPFLEKTQLIFLKAPCQHYHGTRARDSVNHHSPETSRGQRQA